MKSMETVRLSQTDLAKVLGVEQPTLSEATHEGHRIGGYPVQAWAEYDAAGRVTAYEVPLSVAERANPASAEEVMQEASAGLSQNGQSSDMMEVLEQGRKVLAGGMGRTWPDAVAETAAPVSANAGGTLVATEFIGLLKENPSLADYLLDIGVPLTLAGIGAYATEEGEDYRVAKVGGLSIGGWAVIKFVRGIFSQNTGHERELPQQREGEQAKQLSGHRKEGARGRSRATGARRSRNGSITTLGTQS